MKKLLVMRHAKSSWSDASLDDFARPLNDRGRRDAPRMGALLRDEQLIPSVIIASTATRARETAQLITAVSPDFPDIVCEPNIYEATPQTLLNMVLSLDAKKSSAMLVGHNPGVEGLVRALTDEVIPMPTATIVLIESSAHEWSEIANERAKLVRVFRPKEMFV